MSETPLTRDTVELIALSFQDDGMSHEQRQAIAQLVDTDAILRTQLAEMTTLKEQAEHEERRWMAADSQRVAQALRNGAPACDLKREVADPTGKLAAEWHRAATHDSSIDEQERIRELQQQLGDLTARLAAVEWEREELKADSMAEGNAFRVFVKEIMVTGTPLADKGPISFGKLKEVVEYTLADRDATIQAQLREAASLNACIADLESKLTRARQVLESAAILYASVEDMPATQRSIDAVRDAARQALREMDKEQL